MNKTFSGKMKLQLKNVKVHDEMSEETTCFSAYLYINGVKAAYCCNRGCGGMTTVDFLEGTDKLSLAFMQWCKANPIVQEHGGKRYEFHGVDHRVDELLYEHLMKLELKRRQLTQLVLHKNDSPDPDFVMHSYVRIGCGIKNMQEKYPEMLKSTCEKYIKMGFKILNTNIKYKELGICLTT